MDQSIVAGRSLCVGMIASVLAYAESQLGSTCHRGVVGASIDARVNADVIGHVLARCWALRPQPN